MFAKTVTYTDFNGNEKTEKVYFNLTKSEIIKLQASVDGGLSEAIEKIQKGGDPYKIVPLFDKILLAAYGEKSEDGSRFIKNAMLTEAFSQSAAYDAIFSELMLDKDAASEFFTKVIPADMQGQISAELAKQVVDADN